MAYFASVVVSEVKLSVKLKKKFSYKILTLQIEIGMISVTGTYSVSSKSWIKLKEKLPGT